MKTRTALATTLRSIANKLDPPQKIREVGIDLRPADVERLMGFDHPGPIEDPADWTWTQSGGSIDGGYL